MDFNLGLDVCSRFSRRGKPYLLVALVLALAVFALACSRGSEPTPAAPTEVSSPTSSPGAVAPAPDDSMPPVVPAQMQPGGDSDDVTYTPDITFRLRTEIAEGGLAFISEGGGIDGVVNPTLKVRDNAVVQVTLVNGDGATNRVRGQGASSITVFRASKSGEFAYFCTLPGHRAAGMEGVLVVGEGAEAAAAQGADITRDPTDIPAPVGARGPQMVSVDMEAVELEGQLANGTTYTYWTFDSRVPGPFLHVREGYTVELELANRAGNQMIHSIDLHAVTDPGGGAALMQVPPGATKGFTFKALNPGLYVYHCATPSVAEHISNGMYGLILVEPEGGLPPVDKEFYVMQGEIYTSEPFREHGQTEFSVEKLLDEEPEYLVFNGAVEALTTAEHIMKASVGDTVRIFFGVGGPNLISSFHVIGEIFDRVYDQASITAPPLTDVSTTLVPPGGATIVEFDLQVPGRYTLVDHALSRAERGLVAFLDAEGPDSSEVFRAGTGQ
jgi:nitrite reductase (NO-forming)